MAQFNEFLSLIDFETMREYCMANGKTVSYAKGDCFTDAGTVGKYVGFVKSGYFKYCVLTSKGDYAVTGFSFADECIMDFTQSFIFDKPSKISILAGCDSEVVQVPLRTLRDFTTKNNPTLIPHMSAIVLEEAYGRYLHLYQKSPTERYIELVEKYPDVLHQVALRDIASYLLVTPTSLSRIRKKFTQ
ncbi:MAG: Crp/Fnr family transcriptional regulator [Firmicutes bacterium]|nr:Crp/Fnr family transcriptional regulator [Bacillota bacterium]MCM1401773.1 Crp/Fnr family transcriptional regulator [Bacteroides sp.]MCM1477641.1 Crp/Fnr family transcriptional regulator [Bacteroides sp.]